MKKLLIAGLFLSSFAFAEGEVCLARATAMAQDQLDSNVNYAINHPSPDNAKYLPCAGQKVQLRSVKAMDNGFGYIYDRYDFVANCANMTTITGFWAEFYDTANGCMLRGE